jgi:hypothetical protein
VREMGKTTMARMRGMATPIAAGDRRLEFGVRRLGFAVWGAVTNSCSVGFAVWRLGNRSRTGFDSG